LGKGLVHFSGKALFEPFDALWDLAGGGVCEPLKLPSAAQRAVFFGSAGGHLQAFRAIFIVFGPKKQAGSGKKKDSNNG
jgi:hypothetical protein